MHPPDLDLPDAELEVLKILWDQAPATVRSVMNVLHERGRKVAYTTVLTFLGRLEARGYVTCDKSGQAYNYRPRLTREKVTKVRLQSLLEDLYDGAAGPLVLQLVRERRFTEREIEELHALIDQLDQTSS